MWLFDPVVNNIINHISEILKNTIMKNRCDYIILVGGLGSSPYLKYKIENKFPSIPIYQPKRPMLAVVDGAARFGLQNHYTLCVTERIMNKTLWIQNLLHCKRSFRK